MAHKPRRTALVVTVLFCASLLAALAHRARETHGVCAQHGALAHVHGETEVARRIATSPSLRDNAHLHGAHGCLALELLAQASQLLVHRGLRARTTAMGLSRVLQRLAPAHRPAALLVEAPKHSPPPARSRS